MRSLYCLFILLPGLLGGACSMQQDITIDVPPHTPVTFVECYLEPGQPARALATKSVGFFEGVEIEPANNLQLYLYHNGVPFSLANTVVIDSSQREIYNYNAAYEIAHDTSSQWELVVHQDEREIARSSARFLSKPKISDILYSVGAVDSIVSVEVHVADDPQQDNFYRLRVKWKGSSRGGGFEGIWTDQSASGGKIKLNAGAALKAYNDTILVSVYQIDEAYYTFLRSLEKARDANYNPFAQPANVEGNLKGEAIGIFTAMSGTTEIIVLDR